MPRSPVRTCASRPVPSRRAGWPGALRLVSPLALALACEGPQGAPAAPAPEQGAGQVALAAAEGPRFVAAPEQGDVATIVREEVARAAGRVIVYAGAAWCDPCKAFHDALAAGELDAPLRGFTFLEFDIDRDRERLAEAGYKSRYVPLFALPAGDGRASGRQIQGGIKGPKAVAHIMARLQPLLAAPEP